MATHLKHWYGHLSTAHMATHTWPSPTPTHTWLYPHLAHWVCREDPGCFRLRGDDGSETTILGLAPYVPVCAPCDCGSLVSNSRDDFAGFRGPDVNGGNVYKKDDTLFFNGGFTSGVVTALFSCPGCEKTQILPQVVVDGVVSSVCKAPRTASCLHFNAAVIIGLDRSTNRFHNPVNQAFGEYCILHMNVLHTYST